MGSQGTVCRAAWLPTCPRQQHQSQPPHAPRCGLIDTPITTIVAVLLCAFATPVVAAAADGQRLFGTGISREPNDTRRLTIKAEPTDGGAADGRVTFQHNNDPNGISRFKGTVTCLQITGAVAQISGTVTRGETALGVILTGKQYAFTITLGDTQRFSLPRFADTIVPCSGGNPTKTVAVTQGHYTTR